MKKQKTWFITGTSRGLGFEMAKAALESGDKVIATVRSNPERLKDQLKSPNLYVVTLDVTDELAVNDVIARAADHFGQINVVVNNAGYGLLSAVEEASSQEIRKNFDTNVFGTLNVIRAVLPYLRKYREGHIINISSVGGLSGSAGWGLYNSTKFAVEGFSEALSKELSPLGIHVSIVEPGYFRTNFLDGSSLTRTSNIIADYSDTVGKMRDFATQVNYKQPGDPVRLSKAVVMIANSEKPPLHLLLGNDTLNVYRTKTAALEKDIADWQEIITGTAHSDIDL